VVVNAENTYAGKGPERRGSTKNGGKGPQKDGVEGSWKNPSEWQGANGKKELTKKGPILTASD